MKRMKVWLLVLVIGVASCTGVKEAAFERGVDLFLANQLQDASKLLEASVTLMPGNPEAFAWYAECLRRMGEYDRAAEFAYGALKIDPDHAFAHAVLGDLFNPMYSTWSRVNAESTWFHLLAAVKSDPHDGNAWLALWPQTIMRGETDLEVTADTMMIATGFLTEPLLAYNRWMLRDLPENAILITNGDFDTFPAVALQKREGLRQDVAIFNLNLLNVDWYAHAIAERYGIELPFDQAELQNLQSYRNKSGKVITKAIQIVRGWFDMLGRGQLTRPLCLAITVERKGIISDVEEHTVLCGAYYEVTPGKGDRIDLERVARSIEELEVSDFEGSFYSDMDRSPIRRATANNLAANLTGLMLIYASELLDRGQSEEARQVVEKARIFDTSIAARGRFTTQIDSLLRGRS